jgi:hypothetical protein
MYDRGTAHSDIVDANDPAPSQDLLEGSGSDQVNNANAQNSTKKGKSLI